MPILRRFAHSLVLVLGLAVLPQMWVQRVIARHSVNRPDFPGTGGEFARHLLDGMKLGHVKVEETGLGDHYDPDAKALRLLPQHLEGRSLTALVIAAHETGHAMYDVGFSYAYQNYAANDYLVLYTNPRGSTGYGTEFGNAIDNAYPSVDYDDLISRQLAAFAAELAGVDLVVTLGGMSAFRGAALLFAGGGPISGFDAGYRWWGQGYVGPVPVPVILFVLLAIVAHVDQRRRAHVQALGVDRARQPLAGHTSETRQLPALTKSTSPRTRIPSTSWVSRLNTGEPELPPYVSRLATNTAVAEVFRTRAPSATRRTSLRGPRSTPPTSPDSPNADTPCRDSCSTRRLLSRPAQAIRIGSRSGWTGSGARRPGVAPMQATCPGSGSARRRSTSSPSQCADGSNRAGCRSPSSALGPCWNSADE